MEKFRDWVSFRFTTIECIDGVLLFDVFLGRIGGVQVDPSSGMNPWPPLYKKNPNTPLRIINLLLGPFVAIVRIAVFATLFVVALILGMVTAPLVYVPVFGRGLQRFVEVILARLMLLVLGVFWYTAQDYSKQANRDRAANKNKASPTAAGGDLIITNWTSYVDVLYLVYAYSPIFAFVPQAEDKAGDAEFKATAAHRGRITPHTASPAGARALSNNSV